MVVWYTSTYARGPSWLYSTWIYNFLCNRCLSPLMLWVRILLRARCTTLCNKVCQWLAAGRLSSPSTPVSSTNKTNRDDITEILFKVALNTIKPNLKPSNCQASFLYNVLVTLTLYSFWLRLNLIIESLTLYGYTEQEVHIYKTSRYHRQVIFLKLHIYYFYLAKLKTSDLYDDEVKICLWLWKYKGQPTFTSFYFSNHKLFRHAKYAAIWSYRTWQCIMCKILLREH